MFKRSEAGHAAKGLFVICVLVVAVTIYALGSSEKAKLIINFTFALCGWIAVGGYAAAEDRLVKSANKKIEEIKWKFLAQRMVDERLAVFATTFDEECQKQVRLRRDVDDGDDQELVELRMMLEGAKQSFWSAHKLAKELGFEVRPKVGDYLS